LRYVLVELKSMRLDRGDVLHLDHLYYRIGKVDRLYYSYRMTPDKLTPGAVDVTFDITDLKAPLHGIYYWESFGLDGAAQVLVQYPPGNPIMTPEGMRILLDQLMAPRLQPWRVDRHIKPGTYPRLIATNPLKGAIDTYAWFYGWKYLECDVIPEAEAEEARKKGYRVLSVEV